MPLSTTLGALAAGAAIAGATLGAATPLDQDIEQRGAEAAVAPPRLATGARGRRVVSRSADRLATQSAAGAEAGRLQAAARAREAALSRIEDLAGTRAAYLRRNRWVLPFTGYRITATFGDTGSLWSTVHTGVDLAAPTGTVTGAVGAGVITFVGYDGAYGNKVVVTHADGTETWYAHLDTITVAVGQEVAAGQQIGTVGATGNVTGPHLHLEVRPDGQDPVDPVPVLRERGVEL
ncbi:MULTISPECIES: M23 family metallopeptidase [unclassified Nocardioides]|uniref:M23 family metallopeptidase n=1 Tax=unclassified Nocardioides TaxID=2615069 RepID=UPI0002F03B3E|nr:MULTISPECIES: M23 family metallopeptidase [unclassified Nocardioides]